ncbi:MAG: flippase [Parcubacteria group bacterium]
MAELSVTKNTTYLTASYVIQKLLSFVYFIIIARAIGVESLGKYTFAMSFTTMFAVLVDLGFTSALIRESAKFKEKAEKFLSSVLFVKIILALATYGLVILFVNVLDYPSITKNLVYISGIVMAIDQITASFWGVFRGARNLKVESISIVINQIIILAAGFVILFLKLPLVYLMLPFVFGSVFSFLFASVNLRRTLRLKISSRFDWQITKFLFGISFWFALIAVFSRIYGNIDTVMLSKLIGDKAVGWYSVAMKIPFALQFIPAALAAAIFPAFSRHFVNDQFQLKSTFDRTMKFLTILVVPISVGIAFLARPIILTFYGLEYAPSILPLQILMGGLIFVFLNFPLGSLLNGCDRQKQNAILVGATMAFNIVLNIFLIPKYSFVGAGAAFLCSHAFLFVSSLIIANKIIPYSKRNLIKTFFKTVASATAMGAVIFFSQNHLHFAFLIIIGAIVYAAAMFLIRGLTLEDVKYFKERIFHKQT